MQAPGEREKKRKFPSLNISEEVLLFSLRNHQDGNLSRRTVKRGGEEGLFAMYSGREGKRRKDTSVEEKQIVVRKKRRGVAVLSQSKKKKRCVHRSKECRSERTLKEESWKKEHQFPPKGREKKKRNKNKKATKRCRSLTKERKKERESSLLRIKKRERKTKRRAAQLGKMV